MSVDSDVFRQITGLLRKNGINTGADSIVVIDGSSKPDDVTSPQSILLVQTATAAGLPGSAPDNQTLVTSQEVVGHSG